MKRGERRFDVAVVEELVERVRGVREAVGDDDELEVDGHARRCYHLRVAGEAPDEEGQRIQHAFRGARGAAQRLVEEERAERLKLEPRPAPPRRASPSVETPRAATPRAETPPAETPPAAAAPVEARDEDVFADEMRGVASCRRIRAAA